MGGVCTCTKAKFMLIWGFVECALFSGLLCGWASLYELLETNQFYACDFNTSDARNGTTTSLSFPSTDHVTGTGNGANDKFNYLHLNEENEEISKQINDSKTADLKWMKCANCSSHGLMCDEQVRALCWVYVSASVIAGLIMLPFGVLYDLNGTTKIRLLTTLLFAATTMTMTFISLEKPWLLYLGLSLGGSSGFLILLTNIQTANLFPTWRATSILTYHTAFQLGAGVPFLMQVSGNAGMPLQLSFMFYTVGVIPLLVATIALLPKTRVPWPITSQHIAQHESLTNYVRNNHICTTAKASETRSKTQELNATCKHGVLSSFCFSQLLWIFAYSLVFDMMDIHALLWLNNESSSQTYIHGETSMAVSFKYGCLLVMPVLGLLVDVGSSTSQDMGCNQTRVPLRRLVTLQTVLWGISLLVVGLRTLPFSRVHQLLHDLDEVLWTATFGAHALYIYTMFPCRTFGALYGLSLALTRVASILRYPLYILISWADNSFYFMQSFKISILILLLGHLIFLWRRGNQFYVLNYHSSCKEPTTCTTRETEMASANGMDPLTTRGSLLSLEDDL